ncbi:hypothetical protein ZYGR_0AZ02490 [Zygosaccharomyces rouxii]|uniref:Uncharacterized protein n=1 Tax=Zygosaccharomyces rouxii TaxID=4956 RepID=A0A1Q3AK02_ZYGRO|nr:hypothetical protein ZYGR_0AZ02490 [Zygosaccharomyces rouxii]
MNGTTTIPEYKFTSSPQSDNGNSSMIFERTVEDGCSSRPFSRHGSSVSLLSRKYSNQSTGGVGIPSAGSASRGGHRTPRTSQHSSPSQQGSPLDSPELVPGSGPVNPRRHLENFVAPALDASCSIIADDSANLNDLDIVYMRKPSTIGLDLALGRTRSNSYATLREEQLQQQQQQQQQQQADDDREQPPRSDSANGGMDTRPRTLRFYSYADMLSDEMATSPTNSSRPPLLHSASSTFLRPAPQHQPMHFSNPFKTTTAPVGNPNGCSSCGCGNVGRLRKDSMASTGNLNPNVRRYSNNVLSRTTTSSASPAPVPVPSLGSGRSNKLTKPRRGSGFQIESSVSDEFSSDEEDENSFAPSNHNGFSPLGSRVSRTSTQNSINSQPSSQRTSGGSFSNGSQSSMRRESFQNSINGLLMEDTLQTEKVGDILRKRMGNVKKQDLKVTTGEN